MQSFRYTRRQIFNPIPASLPLSDMGKRDRLKKANVITECRLSLTFISACVDKSNDCVEQLHKGRPYILRGRPVPV